MALPPSDRTFKQDLVTGIPIGQQKESAVRPLENTPDHILLDTSWVVKIFGVNILIPIRQAFPLMMKQSPNGVLTGM